MSNGHYKMTIKSVVGDEGKQKHKTITAKTKIELKDNKAMVHHGKQVAYMVTSMEVFKVISQSLEAPDMS